MTFLLLITMFFFIPAAAFAAEARTNVANPDIAANALMLYRNSNRGNSHLSSTPNGMSLQEAEVRFMSDVDPYSRLDIVLSVTPTYDSTTNSVTYSLDPEEAYVQSLSLPFLLKVGKFKAEFGKTNTMHTHALPFIDATLGNRVFFGDEGLNDVGVSGAFLLPTNWYSEITGQLLSGRTEGADYFNSASTNDLVYLLHYKNFFDLSDASTLEIGLSGATGKNSFNRSTDFVGADLTYKWRPVYGGKYHSLTWQTEYIRRVIHRGSSQNRGWSLGSWLQYQFAERWWAQARTEYLEDKDNDLTDPLDIAPFQRQQSALIGFNATEFSQARLQYDDINDGLPRHEQRITLQLNFVIGTHPAHAY